MYAKYIGKKGGILMNSYRSKFMFWLNYAALDGKKPIWKSISGHSLIYYAAISNDDKTIQNKFTPVSSAHIPRKGIR